MPWKACKLGIRSNSKARRNNNDGIKRVWDDKWSIFGNIFTQVALQICGESMRISPEAILLGFFA